MAKTPKKIQKTSANIGFEKQIWDAACVLWGHIPAADDTFRVRHLHSSSVNCQP